MTARIAVLGGGAWGTALAVTCAAPAMMSRLWARDEATVRCAINERHENPLPARSSLDGIDRDDADLEACARTEPTASCRCAGAGLRGASATAHRQDRPNAPARLCAKGIERDTGKRLSRSAGEILPAIRRPPVRPELRHRRGAGLPTAVTSPPKTRRLPPILPRSCSRRRRFRCYSTDDLVGVEIGGALKNVLRDRRRRGHRRQARRQRAGGHGDARLRRIAPHRRAFGARPETLMGLSGLGDLMLTCGSAQSRNFAYGWRSGAATTFDRPAAGGRRRHGRYRRRLARRARHRSADHPTRSRACCLAVDDHQAKPSRPDVAAAESETE
jgi:glycerol-3-phosphate dehydrogenase (NAD(P)+)